MSDDVVELRVDASAGVRAYQEMVDAAARASEAQARFASTMSLSSDKMGGAAAQASAFADAARKASTELERVGFTQSGAAAARMSDALGLASSGIGQMSGGSLAASEALAFHAAQMQRATEAARTATDAHSRLSAATTVATTHIAGAASALDLISKAAGAASTGLDAVGLVPAGIAASEASAKISTVVGVMNTASAAAGYLSELVSKFSSETVSAADANQSLAKVSVQAVDAEGNLLVETKDLVGATESLANAATRASDTQDSLTGYYITAAAALATLTTATYLAYKAIEYIAEKISEAIAAEQAWEGEISGSTALLAALSDASLAAADAHRLLTLEMGSGADVMAKAGGIARDYGISQEAAASALRHVNDILDDTNDGGAKGREIFKDLGITADNAAEALDKFAQRMAGIKDSSAKMHTIREVLGENAQQFLDGIATGAGSISHAFTELDRIQKANANAIADSNARIRELDRAYIADQESKKAATKEFEERQVAALLHISLAAKEFAHEYSSAMASVESGGETISSAWDKTVRLMERIPGLMAAAARSVQDYAQVAAHAAVPRLVNPPAIPDKVDSRPDDPSVHKREVSATDASTSKAVEAARAALEALKLQEENWLTWSRQKEIEYWAQKRQTMLSEMPKTLSAEEAAQTAGVKQIDAIMQGLRRDEAKARATAEETARKERETASNAEADRALKATVLRLRAEEQEVAKNGEAHVAKQREIAEAVRAAKGDDSVEYLAELVKLQQAEREAGQQVARIKMASAETSSKIALAGLEAEREILAQRRAMGEISAVEEADLAIEIEDKKRAVKLAAAQQRLVDLKIHDSMNLEEIKKAESSVTQLMAEQQTQRTRDLKSALLERQRASKATSSIESDGLANQASYGVSIQEENLSFGKSMGTVDGREEIASLRQIAEQKYQIERDLLDKKLQLAGQDEAARATVANQLVDLEQRRALRTLQIDHQEVIGRQATMKSLTAPFGQAIDQMTQGFIQGTLTQKQLVRQAAQSIAASYASMGVKMIANWLHTHVVMAAAENLFAGTAVGRWMGFEATKTAVTSTATATRTGIVGTGEATQTGIKATNTAQQATIVTTGAATETGAVITGEASKNGAIAAGGLTGLAIKAATSIKSIMMDAWTAMAGAYAAIAAIPYVGPVLAPIAAAGAFAAVAGIAYSITSAEGGWGEVPCDGARTVLHKQEMVLPAKYAAPLRDLLTNPSSAGVADRQPPLATSRSASAPGSSGGGVHLHFHGGVNDGEGIKRLIASHGPTLAATLHRQARNGNPSIRPGKGVLR